MAVAAAAEGLGEAPSRPPSAAVLRPWWLELASVLPRSVRFAARASRASAETPGLAPNPLTWATVAVDELTLSTAYLMSRRTAEAMTDDRLGEAVEALELLTAAGVASDPVRWHPDPPPMAATRLSQRRGFEQLSFASGYQPPVEVPGMRRWCDVEINQRGHAFLLRHGDRPRPWLIVLHGHRMGEPRDLRLLASHRMHRELGVDVAHLVLPMHGPRGRGGAPMFPGVDPIANLLGMAQSVSDARSLLGWIRERSELPVAAFGISLGGHVASLFASLAGGLSAVVAGVPTADVATMLGATMRARWGQQAVIDSHVLDPAPLALSRIVSPLSFAPRVDHDRRFLYAAVGDRLVTAGQAVSLWEHWERPTILWLQGAHILNNGLASRRFVASSLVSAGVGQLQCDS